MNYDKHEGKKVPCFMHEGHNYRYYCQNCNLFLCDVCHVESRGEHSRHKLLCYSLLVVDVMDMIKKLLPGAVIKYLQAFALHQAYKLYKTRLDIERGLLRSKITETYCSLKFLLEKWHEKTLNDLDKQMNEVTEDVCTYEQRCAEQVRNIEEKLHTFTILMKRGSDIEIYQRKGELVNMMADFEVDQISQDSIQQQKPLMAVHLTGPLICSMCTNLFGYVQPQASCLQIGDVFSRIMETDLQPALRYLSTPDQQMVDSSDLTKILFNPDDLITWDECLLGENVTEIFVPRECCSGNGYEACSSEGDVETVRRSIFISPEEKDFKPPMLEMKQVQEAKDHLIYNTTGVLVEGQTTKTKPPAAGCVPQTYPTNTGGTAMATGRGWNINATIDDKPARSTSVSNPKINTSEAPPKSACAKKTTTVLGWAELGTNKASRLIGANIESMVLRDPAQLFLGSMRAMTDGAIVFSREGLFFNIRYKDKDLRASIFWSDMTKCFHHFSSLGCMMAILPGMKCAVRLRNMCHMSRMSGPYLNPHGLILKERHVILHFHKRLSIATYSALEEIFDECQELMCRARARHVFTHLVPVKATRFFRLMTGHDLMKAEVKPVHRVPEGESQDPEGESQTADGTSQPSDKVREVTQAMQSKFRATLTVRAGASVKRTSTLFKETGSTGKETRSSGKETRSPGVDDCIGMVSVYKKQ